MRSAEEQRRHELFAAVSQCRAKVAEHEAVLAVVRAKTLTAEGALRWLNCWCHSEEVTYQGKVETVADLLGRPALGAMSAHEVPVVYWRDEGASGHVSGTLLDMVLDRALAEWSTANKEELNATLDLLHFDASTLTARMRELAQWAEDRDCFTDRVYDMDSSATRFWEDAAAWAPAEVKP